MRLKTFTRIYLHLFKLPFYFLKHPIADENIKNTPVECWRPILLLSALCSFIFGFVFYTSCFIPETNFELLYFPSCRAQTTQSRQWQQDLTALNCVNSFNPFSVFLPFLFCFERENFLPTLLPIAAISKYVGTIQAQCCRWTTKKASASSIVPALYIDSIVVTWLYSHRALSVSERNINLISVFLQHLNAHLNQTLGQT